MSIQSFKIVNIVVIYTAATLFFSQALLVEPGNSQINEQAFNLRVTREKFADFSDVLIIKDQEEVYIEIEDVFIKDFNVATGSYDNSEIFSVKNEKFKPNIYKYMQNTEKLSPKQYSSKAPNVYTLNISSAQNSFSSGSSYSEKQEVAMFSEKSSSKTSLTYQEAFLEAKSLIQRENPEKARIILFKMEQIAKDNPSKLAVVAKLYESIDEKVKACELYNKAYNLSPKSLEITYSYAVCLYKNNDLDLAEKYFAKATELDPKFMFAHYNLGNVYYKKGDYHKAINEFEKAMDLEPDNPSIYYNLAISLEVLNHKTLAKRFYQKVLELSPNDMEAKEAMQRLN